MVGVTGGVAVSVAARSGVVVIIPVAGVMLAATGVCGIPERRICHAISRSSLAATGKFGKLERVRSRR